MPVLKLIGVPLILEHAKKGLSKALGGHKATSEVWRICTPLSDGDVTVQKSKFFKSITEDIDDASKLKTFVQLVSALASASTVENYHEFFRGIAVECKEAHGFNHRGTKVKIFELKRLRQKERLYFFPLSAKGMRFFIVLLAHHKKDETTPKNVANYCEAQAIQFIDAGEKIYIQE